MRYFVFFATIIISIVLQSSISFFNLGIQPDFLLILVLFSALLEGPFTGLKVGFVIGLVEDLVTGKFIGIHILTKMLAGYLIGLGEPKIFKENYLVPVVTLFIGTFLHGFLFLFFGSIVGIDISWGKDIWVRILYLALFHGVLAPFVYVPFYKIYVSKWFNKDS
ncbi:MAG: rod shape-determining protein MreD [Bacillota bacterium]|nr:rod shape-determining protein MreD [Clostridia bacterium]